MGDGGDDSKVKISVWWDIENCMVPSSVRPDDIARNINKALRQEHFRGPITIAAYGDTHRLSREVQTAITSTGINLHHIPSGHKDASDKAIIVDMLFWALDNPPPGHILLISGDRDFSNTIHRLHMKNYNILIAGYLAESFSASLLGAATGVWHWTKLARGENAQVSHPRNFDGIYSGIVQPCNISIPVVPLAVSCNTEDGKKMKMSDQSAASLTHRLSEVDSVQGHLPSNMSLPIYSSCIGAILTVMKTLKREMLLPTGANIEACIHWSKQSPINFALRQVLDKAVELGDIMVLSEGISHVQVFIPKNTKLWPFVDLNSPNQYALEHFVCILVQSGRAPNIVAISKPLAATVKGWLRPSPCTWSPLLITARDSFNGLSLPKGSFQPRQSGLEYAQSIEIQLPEQKASKPHMADGNSVIKKLRCWLMYVLCTERARKGYDISSLRKDFEVDCKVKLDPSELGFDKLVDLIKQLKDVARLEYSRPNQCLLFPANERAVLILSKLRSWLRETLCTEKASNGYDISLVKKNFELDCNIKLDRHELGFNKIQDLISLFTDVVHLEHPRKDTCLLFLKESYKSS